MPKKKTTPPQSLPSLIGTRIRLRREAKGLRQSELAYLLGRSVKDVAEYESGHKKLSLARLCHIAKALDVSAGYFLDDPLPPPLPHTTLPAGNREALPLLRAFMALSDAQLRQQAVEYVQGLAHPQNSPEDESA